MTRIHFRLRTALLVFTLFALAFGWAADNYRLRSSHRRDRLEYQERIKALAMSEDALIQKHHEFFVSVINAKLHPPQSDAVPRG